MELRSTGLISFEKHIFLFRDNENTDNRINRALKIARSFFSHPPIKVIL